MADSPQRVGDVMTAEVVTLDAGDHLDLPSDIMTLGRIRWSRYGRCARIRTNPFWN